MRNTPAYGLRARGLRTTLSLSAVLLLFITSCLMPSRAGAASRAIRIRFAPGTISTQVRGQLTKNKALDAEYVVSAKSGDHMIINIIAQTPGLMTSGDVTPPSGDSFGQHGGFVYNRDLTETGDYRITVGRNLMGTERPDGAFILEVVITPASLKEWTSFYDEIENPADSPVSYQASLF